MFLFSIFKLLAPALTDKGADLFCEAQDIITTNAPTKNNATPLGGHAFQQTGTKIAPTPGGHCHENWTIYPNTSVFKLTLTIFKLAQEMIGKNILTRPLER
ncbi:hypothetical protein DPMN_008109 [Dreissena polymorpha]|uniref:Uncharacterized protein n=1 Tax=Dreissena polymorpha TaxID=45954 RepID=A0A9D4MUI7_DREPO|nr:hypothetical protein DPMN_008109 [Dreissena polymorpha]